LKRALKKRQRIQSRKVVNDGYLWSLFDRPRLMERLLGRFKR
jgi:hypothetical protein